ncbi:MAG TPA: 16S rRNA (guanine(966)-N(2))-methyltransferase RsmD, partial [Terriglobales bacterium]|nr:16S rRNA (guanine(966)-N(2))-methyltransferase RsmD [Terriglobales bacterium]
MRIIAGLAKGRRLRTVPGDGVRPTSDKVRGAIFNILGSRISLEGARILDLFAGSGGLGLEALSRGAAHVVFVEQSATVQRLLEQNIDACGFRRCARVMQAPVARALGRLKAEGAQFDGVLLDPPYGKGLIATTLANLASSGLLAPEAWVMAEHHVDEPVAELPQLQLTQTRRYGKTALALLTTGKSM